MTYWGFGLYCPTYDWISTSSWYCSRYYCRDAPRRKTTVPCDIENRCRPSLFDIWGLHRFYRNALTGYGVVSHRAGVRLRNNYHDLRSGWKCDPQDEGQKVGPSSLEMASSSGELDREQLDR